MIDYWHVCHVMVTSSTKANLSCERFLWSLIKNELKIFKYLYVEAIHTGKY